jgi:hypothetical protein
MAATATVAAATMILLDFFILGSPLFFITLF